jgi:hypothetical protein
MKNNLIVLFCLSLLSCGENKTGINIKKKVVSIKEQEICFKEIIPLINQREMKQTGADLEGANTVIHYKDFLGEKKIDLVYKKITNDSLISYQIFARFLEKTTWPSTDTFKVLFGTSDSIQEGIYSVLSGVVSCWTKPVQFKNFPQIGKVRYIQFAYWKHPNNIYAAAMPLGGNGFAFNLENENKGFGAAGTTGYDISIEGEVPVLSLSFGHDFYKLIPSAFQYSFAAMAIPDNLRNKKTKPIIFNYLRWAS